MLVKPQSPVELGKALVTMNSDVERRRVLGRRAQEHALTEHDINQAWPRMLAALTPN
jgi:hypothetical protein